MKLLIYPDRPTAKHKLTNILALLDIEPVYDPKKYPQIKKAIRYEFMDKHHQVYHGFINGDLHNVQKDHVDFIFSKVFGYSTLINPLTHQGVCVKKGNGQCTKDGQVYRCPIVPEQGYVYQKLIDARIDLTHLQVIRVPVMIWGKQEVIPFVWTVTKHVRWTFKDPRFMYSKKLKCHETSELFSRDEIVRILEFSVQMGINWAELDVLRDSDGRIYVIDVNNIPGNHAFYMMPFKYVERYVRTFKEVLL